MPDKNDKGAIETLSDAVAAGDKELDKEIPGATFAVVGLTYPFILVIILVIIGLFYWLR